MANAAIVGQIGRLSWPMTALSAKASPKDQGSAVSACSGAGRFPYPTENRWPCGNRVTPMRGSGLDARYGSRQYYPSECRTIEGPVAEATGPSHS